MVLKEIGDRIKLNIEVINPNQFHFPFAESISGELTVTEVTAEFISVADEGGDQLGTHTQTPEKKECIYIQIIKQTRGDGKEKTESLIRSVTKSGDLSSTN